MMDEYGLAWPWESLHVEALAWFDHWLKGRETGILDGPAICYLVPCAEGWRTAESWPISGTVHRALALCSDGSLGADEGEPGSRQLIALSPGLTSTAGRNDKPTLEPFMDERSL